MTKGEYPDVVRQYAMRWLTPNDLLIPQIGENRLATMAVQLCDYYEAAQEQIKNLSAAVEERSAEIERLTCHIKQLAHDHSDMPVSWPFNGRTYYQDIHDWASFVLYGGK